MCFHAARQPDVAAQEGGKRKTVPLHRVEILPAFPKGFYRSLDNRLIPGDAKRDKTSLRVLPSDRPDIRSLFESVIPYFEAGEKPSEDMLKLKMTEGVYVLLRTDRNLYASLFDFVEPWKIDILDYLNENYMLDLSMNEIASYTGRSLATFKRDFAKVSDLPPQSGLSNAVWKPPAT